MIFTFSDKIMFIQATLIATVVLMYGKICTAYSVPYIMPGLNITKIYVLENI